MILKDFAAHTNSYITIAINLMIVSLVLDFINHYLQHFLTERAPIYLNWRLWFLKNFLNSKPHMLLVLAVKTYVLGGCMTPIAFGVLGTGILFGCYNLAVARNPEENENLFNATLMGFALMETFVFTSLIVGYLIYSL